MLASELIRDLAEALVKHGDHPIVIYSYRTDTYLEANLVYTKTEEYQGENMELKTELVSEIEC